MAYNLVSGTVTSETRRMWGGFIRRVDHSLVRHVTWGHKTRIDECDLHDKTLPEAWYPGASV